MNRAWQTRRWAVRQRRMDLALTKQMRAIGITWPPRVGQMVCDCRYVHQRVVSVDEYGDAILEDGGSFSIRACLGPADHDPSDHPSEDEAVSPGL